MRICVSWGKYLKQYNAHDEGDFVSLVYIPTVD